MQLRSKRIITGLVFSLLVSMVPVLAQSPIEPRPTIQASGPYEIGERLTYNASFASFTTAAHAEIWIAGRGQYLNRDGLELRARVETTDIVSAALYAINNDYTSYVDPATGLPYYTKISIHEGGRNAEFANEYNAAAGTAAIPDQVRKGEFLGVYDFLSAAYRLRGVSFSDGAVYGFTLRGENSEYEVEAKPAGRKLIKSSIGSFNALVVELRFPHDSELDKYKIKVFFTDDARRVPLLATAHHHNGEIRVAISSSEIVKPAPKPGSPIGPPVVRLPPVPPPPNSAGAKGGAIVPGIPGISMTGNPANPAGQVAGIPMGGPSRGAANPSGSLAVRPFPSELPFTADEALNYTVFLQGATQPVGLISFRVSGRNYYFGNDAIMVSAKAETANAAKNLFYANEQVTSYLDPVSLLPNRTDLAFLGTRVALSETVQFDQDRGAALVKKGQMEVPVGTHDLLSVIYAIRSFNLNPGKAAKVPVLINGFIYEITINSLKRETIQIGSQSIPSYQLSVTTSEAEPDHYLIRLWISDDQRRLPLRLTAKTPAGQITADLAITPAR
ncbi:MAG: DUF3108 domain-containing protein [Pyrinomonadaceae bacterium]